MLTSNQPKRTAQIAELEADWATNPRWAHVKRGYTAEDVVNLRGSFQPQYSFGPARRG